jgi:ribosomal protein S18 acetylase RimI-like enzyme
MSNAAAITIRACGLADAQALALVGSATFLETFAGVLGGDDVLAHCAGQHAAAHYQAWLADPDCELYLAVAAPREAPVGYLVLAPAALPGAREGDLEVKRIYLLHRFQGGGLGRRLMDEAISRARARGAARLLLGVYAGNGTALAFYRRIGFQEIGQRLFTVGGVGYEDRVLALGLDGHDAGEEA